MNGLVRSIVVDSGPLIALFDGSDQHHARAVDFLRALEGRLVTNLPVITEVVYMLDFSREAQRDCLFWAQLSLTIDTGTVGDLPRIRAILDNYADLGADFAAASLVALCERLKVITVARVDSDFTLCCTPDRRPFRSLFFEVSPPASSAR